MSKYFSLHIEFMRIIACYFVIFNHTGNQGYFLFSLYSPDCISYWICLFFSIFCKFAVPLFLCISGTLLLKNTKNESIFYVMKHRIFRFVIVLISFSFFYYLVEIFINNPQKFNIITFFYVLINKDWNYSYWYLYLLIAFLLTLPILCKLRKNLTNIHYIYCFSLYIFFVPIVLLFSFFLDININNLLIPNFFTSIIIIYPLLGDFIERIFKMEINTHVLIKMWLVNIFFIVVSSILTYYRAVIYTGGLCSEAESQYFHNTFVIINCFCIYVTVKYMFKKYIINNMLKNVILILGKCSFGIYLFHLFVLNILNRTMLLTFLEEILCIPPLCSIFIYCFCVLIISFIITYLLKKLPYVNKFI